MYPFYIEDLQKMPYFCTLFIFSLTLVDIFLTQSMEILHSSAIFSNDFPLALPSKTSISRLTKLHSCRKKSNSDLTHRLIIILHLILMIVDTLNSYDCIVASNNRCTYCYCFLSIWNLKCCPYYSI